MPRTSVALATLVLVTVTTAHAHPGVHERIDRATAELEAHPTADGYLQRALLYLEHDEHELAGADVRAAERLGGATAETRWLALRVLHETEEHELVLERIAALPPEERSTTRARLMKSRALADLARLPEADTAMQAALADLAPPSVDLYLEAAALREEMGRSADARETLVAGVADHPESVPLRLALFRLDRDRGAHARALEDLEDLTPELREAPRYLVERARLEAALGRDGDARSTYARAGEALAALPPVRRTAPAMEELAEAIEAEAPPPATTTAPPEPDDGGFAAPIAVTALLLGGVVFWWWRRRDPHTE